MALTPKQEKFVRALVEGCSQREAYRAAYRADRMSERVIDNKACLLFANGKVRVRYDELVAEAAKSAVFTLEDAIAIHQDSIRRLDEYLGWEQEGKSLPAQHVRERRETVAELSKLLRLYEATQGDDGKVVIVDDL